ncbi:helix-turn-helix domain-containing protein [Paenibacillus elgii]|uniref:helix-turn-helix domain-containing protein n=1 Tax=Paenibacillus elgii TaxID=189691 RepID=UPI0013D23598|nr:AraC family transcriptional regulator [Paenibacillus elgii]NEN83886.1 helix-turn-helix transcriptional regulator [Paenibacillus elgii]
MNGIDMTHIELRDAGLRATGFYSFDGGCHNEVPSDRKNGEAYLLLLALKGRGELRMDAESFVVLSGYYYLVPPEYGCKLALSTEGRALGVRFELCDGGLERIVRAMPWTGACGSAAVSDIEYWLQAGGLPGDTDDPLASYRMDAAVKTVLLTLARLGTGRKPLTHELRSEQALSGGGPFPMADYIRNHYAAKVTLDDMAKRFGFHPHYIIRLFNRRLGMSPIQYLQEVRLLKAMELLETTSMTVTEISESVGWTTSYFSRLFHERKGESPSQFRKKKMKSAVSAMKHF